MQLRECKITRAHTIWPSLYFFIRESIFNGTRTERIIYSSAIFTYNKSRASSWVSEIASDIETVAAWITSCIGDFNSLQDRQGGLEHFFIINLKLSKCSAFYRDCICRFPRTEITILQSSNRLCDSFVKESAIYIYATAWMMILNERLESCNWFARYVF